MKLLTEELRNTLPKLYSQEKIPLAQQICRVKFFSPYSDWTWFATEAQPTEDGDTLFFGWVQGNEGEAGYFVLSELESVNLPGCVPVVERDLYFTPKPLGLLVDALKGKYEALSAAQAAVS